MSRRDLGVGAGALALSSVLSSLARAETGVSVAPERYCISVDNAKLTLIAKQVELARLPRGVGGEDWSTGMSVAWLAAAQRRWLNGYDWRAAETEFNRYPQYRTTIDGQSLHFLRLEGKGASSRPPLLLLHGWPYTNLSFIPFVDRLTDPARFGGDPASAMTVIAPALPGYGFGGPLTHRFGPRGSAELFHKLMVGLGYDRYGVQGGDHGAVVGTWMAHLQPQAVRGLHLNMMVTRPEDPATLAPAEAAWAKTAADYMAAQMDYLRLQTNKPMMVGAALAASPLATAAWIGEKYWAWSDNDGTLESAFPMDRLLTEIMQYVVTDTIETSFWHYRGGRDEIHGAYHPGPRITVPTAGARFAKDYPHGRPPRSIAERNYNIVRFTDFPHGGHFPFLEQPEPFAGDILAFFASLPA